MNRMLEPTENRHIASMNLCRSIAKHLIKTGEYDTWKLSANKLNTEGLPLFLMILFISLVTNSTSCCEPPNADEFSIPLLTK